VRILVYEFASGGGLAMRDVPASLAREGAGMRAALVADLLAAGHAVVTTTDDRVRDNRLRGADVVTLPAGDHAREAILERLIGGVDAVWVVAPETDRCLERLAARAERQWKPLLGSSADAIRRASNKARLPALLRTLQIRHPRTRAMDGVADAARTARELGYPLVVKPARGAGSHAVSLVHGPGDLRRAVTLARSANRRGRVLLQEYVLGAPASVSLVANGRDAAALTLNAQAIGPSFAYQGGLTPFDHPLASRALAAAVNTCRALPGLRGFVGVDLVLTASDVYVIEVNPRLTTAYLGVRAAVDENVAALALAACEGVLPPALRVRRSIRFTSTGRITIRESAERGAA